MDIRQLRYFVGVVDAGSFTRAAARLAISQSALSLHVRQMEDSFGTILLVRERNGIRLTAPGAKLLDHARIILRQVALAEAELTNKVASPAGEVSIGIPSGAARLMVAKLLATARDEIPNVSLKIVEGMSGPLDEWMLAGRFNLSLSYRTPDSIGRNLELAREEFCLVAHPALPPFGETVRLSELYSFPLAVPGPINSARRTLADAVARQGCALDVRFEVDSLSTIVKMVADRDAYSILTPSAIQLEARSGLVKIINIVDPVIARSIVVITNPRDEQDHLVTATRSVLTNVVRGLIANGDWPATLNPLTK